MTAVPGWAADPRSAAHALGYISVYMRERLASGRPLDGVESETVQGALLLSDIEGWTPQVERLRGLGSEGLDELARGLNAYFALVAETVYAHGGDVLTVAGDAFLCLWPVDDVSEMAEASLLATQAGLAFQAASADLPRPGGIPIRTRIGVAAGELQLALVGGVNGRWEVLPAGGTLNDVVVAEISAPSGGVVLARSAWDLVSDRVVGQPPGRRDLVAVSAVKRPVDLPVVAPTTYEIPADVIAPFVPAPVRAWSVDSGTEWLAELRHVTVVMARLLDRDVDPGQAIEHSQRAIRAFQETVAHFEGASKPGMDNKGLTLSAVFGLPPRAHEDDAERALRAAADLQAALADLGLPCSLGVASGRAFCGLFGSDLRREYALYGEVTNLSARLAYAGRGEILCDDVTPRLVGERFEFEALPPITVKGMEDPVAVSRFTGMRAVPPRHSELVDRAPQRGVIRGRLERLTSAGEPGVIVLEGDAGIGKSALVAESVRMAVAEGVRVLTAAADAVERTTAYYAWRPVFVDALDLADPAQPADPAQLADQALQRIGGAPEIERLIPLLSSVLTAAIPDNEWTEAMTGDVRADNTAMLLTRVLARLTADEPVLLVVEDAHWLDSSSGALLRRVVNSVPRLLTIVTTRPSPAPDEEHDDLLSLASDGPQRLTPLSPEHTSALVRQRLGVAAIPADLSRFVEARVAGHPFFCEALVRTMQEAGAVRVQDGATVVGDLTQLDVPSTVEGAVLSLVDRLTPAQQLSLKVAAVVGPSFSVQTVSEAHPLGAARSGVVDDLQALATLDLVVPEAGEDGTYAFRHEIMRDVAYGLLTESQRRPLHRAVAESYERRYSPQELEPHHALLAHHWAQAEDAPKAIAYLEQAGRAALRGGAFREAAQFYAELRVQAQRDGSWETNTARRVLCQKGEAAAYYYLGDFERCRALIEDAVARLDRTVPKQPRALTASLAAVAGRQVAHLAAPRRYRNRRVADKRLLDEAVDCYKTLVQISYLNGESGAALFYVMLAGLNLGEEAGSSPQLARALVNAAGVTSMLNLRRLADSYAARAVQMADLEGQSEALAYVWNIQAIMAAQRGQWRRGIRAGDRALQVFGEIGDYNLEAELWQTRSALHICAGDFRGAEACWRRTRELAARNVNPQLETWSWLDEVQTRVGRDETEAAAIALEAALAIDTPASDGGTLIEKHWSTAATRLRQGRFEEAVSAADAVIEMVTAQMPTGFHWADFAAGAVEVYLEMLEGETDPALRASLQLRARRGCKALRKISWTFHGIRPRRRLLEGRLDWEQGQRSQARRHWLAAERVATAMEMEYDVARARLELIRHGLASDSAAARAQVAETFARLGAHHWQAVAEGA